MGRLCNVPEDAAEGHNATKPRETDMDIVIAQAKRTLEQKKQNILASKIEYHKIFTNVARAAIRDHRDMDVSTIRTGSPAPVGENPVRSLCMQSASPYFAYDAHGLCQLGTICRSCEWKWPMRGNIKYCIICQRPTDAVRCRADKIRGWLRTSLQMTSIQVEMWINRTNPG